MSKKDHCVLEEEEEEEDIVYQHEKDEDNEEEEVGTGNGNEAEGDSEGALHMPAESIEAFNRAQKKRLFFHVYKSS